MKLTDGKNILIFTCAFGDIEIFIAPLDPKSSCRYHDGTVCMSKISFKVDRVRLSEDDAIILRAILENTSVEYLELTIDRYVPTTPAKVFRVRRLMGVRYYVPTTTMYTAQEEKGKYCFSWNMEEICE